MFDLQPVYHDSSDDFQLAIEGTIVDSHVIYPIHDFHHGEDNPFNLYSLAISYQQAHSDTERVLEMEVDVLRQRFYREMNEWERMEMEAVPEEARYKHPHFIKGYDVLFSSKFPPKLMESLKEVKRDQDLIGRYVKCGFRVQFQKDLNVFLTPSYIQPILTPHERQMIQDEIDNEGKEVDDTF